MQQAEDPGSLEEEALKMGFHRVTKGTWMERLGILNGWKERNGVSGTVREEPREHQGQDTKISARGKERE